MKIRLPIPLLSILVATVSILLLTACGPTGSTNNDEIHSVKKEQTDYLQWSKGLKSLAASNTAPTPTPKASVKLDPAQLPHEDAVRAALQRRLPEDLKLVKLEPISVEKNDDGVSATYAVETKAKSALTLVPVGDPTPAKASSVRKRLMKYLIFASDLPPGKTYLADQSKKIVAEKETLSFPWTVREAVLEKNVWKVTNAEPVIYQRDPKLEARFIQESVGTKPFVLRSEEELALAKAQSDTELTGFEARLKDINDKVDAYRSQAEQGIPAPPVDKEGGAGSGTPTKTAIGAGAGAGAGAGIGYAAGGGEGAAIGAGAGLVVGGLAGFAIGRSDEQDELDRKNAERNAAKRRANTLISNYESALINAYEQELINKAQAHLQTLQGKK